MNDRQRKIALGWVFVAVVIAPFTAAIFLQSSGETEFGIDGSYYFQVARHVSEGDGLMTSASLYHQGLRRLPARTNIYPLWPLVLGFAGRFFRLSAAAHVVPRALYVLDLFLLYALSLRLLAVQSGSQATGGQALNAGHLIVALFASNPVLFGASSFPYTEPLAFALLFAALLTLDRVWIGATGALAALAYLARAQLAVFGLALLLACLIRRRWRDAGVFFGAYAVTVAPWVVYLTTFVRPFTARALIDFYSETPQLPMFDQAVPLHGTLAVLADRLSGLAVAFDPLSRFSFVHSFGPAAYLVPAAGIHFLWKRRPSGGALLPLGTFLAGLLLSVMLLFAHLRLLFSWLFGYRHGLPFILLLMMGVIELTAMSGSAVRCAAVAISIVSVVIGALSVGMIATRPPHVWPPPEDAQLVQWLAAHDPHAVVLSTNAQVLSAISRANFRWAACQDDPQTIRLLLQLVHTDYVAAYDGEQGCPFLRQLVGPELEVLGVFGRVPHRVFLMRVRRPVPVPGGAAPYTHTE